MMPPEGYKYLHLLFDWDGVIQNTLAHWLQAAIAGLLEQGVILSPAVIAREIIPNLEKCGNFGVRDSHKFVNGVISQVHPQLPMACFNNDVVTMLRKLKGKGVKVAIVSSSSREVIKKSMELQHVPSDFYHTLITPDVPEVFGIRKPRPEPIQHAIKLLGGTMETSLMVGDSSADINGAKQAGIPVAWFFPPENQNFYDEEKMLELHPTYVARSVTELHSIIRG